MNSRTGANLDLVAQGIGERGQRFGLASQQLLGDTRGHGDGDSPADKAGQRVSDLTQQIVGHGFVGEQVAPALAVHAGFAKGLDEILPGSLAGHFDQTELGNLQNIGACLVASKGFSQGPVGFISMVGGFHVDEVDDDQAADIAKSELVDDFLNGLEIRLVDRLL